MKIAKRALLIVQILILLAMSAMASQVETDLKVEHQIRLCDTKENVIEKLKLEATSFSTQSIMYIETADRYYQQNRWTLRLKINANTVTLDAKKRYAQDEATPVINKIKCELDKHAQILEKTCKLSQQISRSLFESVVNKNRPWSDLLNSDQKNWLLNESEIKSEVNILGTLIADRNEFIHPELGKITTDIVSVKNDEKITYHEISIRYPHSQVSHYADLFESFIAESGVVACSNQEEWDFKKFDILKNTTSLNQ